ncbi:MAG: aminotransferase class IV [Hominisplanchenecus sp.]
MQITADDGFYFGLGVFETIAVEQGRPLLLTRHLKRLEEGMAFLGLHRKVDGAEILSYLEQYPPSEEKRHGALKITVTEENVLFGLRASHYTGEQYRKGFVLQFSDIRRNETSPFTYHKTLNYGDCILEKRKARSLGADELIFLNTRGEICEGCTTNIFFGREGKLTAPPLTCGMLPGVMRQLVYEKAAVRNMEITERILYPQDLKDFDECFVTNSLLGIMPVQKFGSQNFPSRDCARRLCPGSLL